MLLNHGSAKYYSIRTWHVTTIQNSFMKILFYMQWAVVVKWRDFQDLVVLLHMVEDCRALTVGALFYTFVQNTSLHGTSCRHHKSLCTHSSDHISQL